MTKELLEAVYKCINEEIQRDVNTGERFTDDEGELICKARDELKKELDQGSLQLVMPLTNGYEIVAEIYSSSIEHEELCVYLRHKEDGILDICQDLVVIDRGKYPGMLDLRVYGDCNDEDYTEKYGINIYGYKENNQYKLDVQSVSEEQDVDYAMKAWMLNLIISSMNNEDAYYEYGGWLDIWPDEESWESCKHDFSSKENYEELEKYFIAAYKEYHEDGLYEATPDVVKAAHEWDQKLNLSPIENIK